MVESQPSKLIAWVRFPSPAPFFKNHIKLTSLVNKLLGCRQAVRHETLTLAFVGSNPATPANFKTWEPLMSDIGVSPSGKAWDSDSHIRGFETFHPSQLKTKENMVH